MGEADVIQVDTGGILRHTWAHPDIAIAVAMWISPDFGAAVRRLIRRYMEGRVTAAESAAVQAAVQAAAIPVQPEPALPAKRPASELDDDVVASICRTKQQSEHEFGALQQMVQNSTTMLDTLLDLAEGTPASVQLVQTLKTNTIIRVGGAVENAQQRVIDSACGMQLRATRDPVTTGPVTASPTSTQLDLRRSITVQQVAASKHLPSIYLTSQALSKIGMEAAKAWRALGGRSLVLGATGAQEFLENANMAVPFVGDLGTAMETHRIKFSQAYRGALEIAAFENISHDAWLYPRNPALGLIEQAISAYVAADRAGGHASITRHFVRV